MKKINVKTYIPFLAHQFVEEEVKFDYKNYDKLLKDNKEKLGDFEKYICRLHDSWITDFILDRDKITLKINDFDTHIVSDVIVDRYDLKINHNKLVFPLEITFIGDVSWRAYIVDDDGFMTETSQVDKLDQYLYEQILHVDKGKIKIALVFWKDAGGYIIVEITANNLFVNELQYKAWQDIFKDEYNAQISFFRKLRFSDYHEFGFDYCKKLLDNFIKASN